MLNDVVKSASAASSDKCRLHLKILLCAGVRMITIDRHDIHLVSLNDFFQPTHTFALVELAKAATQLAHSKWHPQMEACDRFRVSADEPSPWKIYADHRRVRTNTTAEYEEDLFSMVPTSTNILGESSN